MVVLGKIPHPAGSRGEGAVRLDNYIASVARADGTMQSNAEVIRYHNFGTTWGVSTIALVSDEGPRPVKFQVGASVLVDEDLKAKLERVSFGAGKQNAEALGENGGGEAGPFRGEKGIYRYLHGQHLRLSRGASLQP